jgi:hypothetical protein
MKKLILLVLAISIGIVAVFYSRQQNDQQQQRLQIPVQPHESALSDENEEPSIRFPIPEVQPQAEEQDTGQQAETAQPLPPLDLSDGEMQNGLAGLIGMATLMKLFNPKDMIRHIVVTIDNLPRSQYAVKYLPTKPVTGQFIVSGKEDHTTISMANYQRYTAYVQLVETVDTDALISMYSRLYPLFQQAYEDLGYPSGYFNDRLIEVMDLMLDTPEVHDPVELIRPNVLYEYADEELEKLPAGQKILIRMGNDNAVRVKAKLRELRRGLTANSLDD